MRVSSILIVCALGGLVHAEPDETTVPAPLPARGESLVAPSATWRWQIVTAPRLAPQIGALAISGLDVVAGRAASTLAVLGEGAAPAGWPFAIEGTTMRAVPAAAPDQRIAAAYGVTTFTLTDKDQGMAMLELRLRYEDGVSAWLNGVEVARAALPRSGTVELAVRPHGPEWETFYIPVGPALLRLGANVLAIEVHPSGRRDAPTIAVDLIGRRDRGIVHGPVLSQVAETSARITVETDPNTEAILEWGTGRELAHKLTSPPATQHSFTLTNLPVRGQVRYRVHAGASQSALMTFHTMPRIGEVVRLGVYGDVRGGHGVHRRLIDAMLAEPLDAVLVTGDMVLHGSDEGDWQRFHAITQPLLGQLLYLPAVGNHDLGWEGADPARRADEVFTLPPGPPGRPVGSYWYSYDLADVHLVFLDSNSYERVEQEAWLDADLAAARARKVRAIIAITHDGPYSRGHHKGNTEARTRFVPILVKHRVDLLFSGHDHIYQRGEIGGLRYVVTGGGGASLYSVTCGVSGKPACAVEDGMQKVAREHHFLVVTVTTTGLELCARRGDGRLLEKCTRYSLHRD